MAHIKREEIKTGKPIAAKEFEKENKSPQFPEISGNGEILGTE